MGCSYLVPCKGNSRMSLGRPHDVMTKCAWVTLYAGVGCNVLNDTTTFYRTHSRSLRRIVQTTYIGDDANTGDGRDLYRRNAGGR